MRNHSALAGRSAWLGGNAPTQLPPIAAVAPFIKSLLVVLLLLTCAPASAAEAVSMTAGLEFSQAYRPQSWEPVRFQLRNPSDRVVDGSAILPLTDANAPVRMEVPVRVPPSSTVVTTVWGYFARPAAQPKGGDGRAAPL